MNPLHAIILLFLIQIAGYILLDRYALPKLKYLLLSVIFIFHIFILPDYFIPKHPDGQPGCGMPALAITLGFWIVGGGLTLLTHCIYALIKHFRSKRSQAENGQER